MPQVTAPDGTTKYVPGVYFDTKVRSNLPGPLPEFQIPVILGPCFEGHPYDADTKTETGEAMLGTAKFFGTAGACGDYYGRGSEMHRAFVWAQRHGLPGAYCIGLSPMVRASAMADIAGVNQAKVYSRTFGPVGGWTKVGFAAGVLTIQKVKNYALFAANVGATATRIELKGDTDWIVEGGVYQMGDNTTAIGPVEVLNKREEISATGQRVVAIDLVTTFGSALTTALYGMIAEYETTIETFSGLSTGQLFIDAFLTSKILGAQKQTATFTGGVPDSVPAPLPIKQLTTWATVVVGTAPTAAATDVASLVTLFNAGAWQDFLLRFDVIPQAYLLVIGDATSHGHMRDYAITERARGYAISVTTGVRWGDHVIDAGDATDPLFRTQALNSQDVALWGPGLDKDDPYLSLAPAVFGLRCKGGIGHNLTNDDLKFSELERRWNEVGLLELTRLLRGGFGTLKLSTGRTIRYRIAQGLNTLQSNAGLIWNVATKDTWSIMQRDLADFVDRVQFVDLEEDVVGADGVNASVIAAALRSRAEKSLIKRGYLVEYTITSILLNDGANGYDVQASYRLPTTNDYVTLDNTILIG